MKTLCIFGTRPEAIKMAPIVKALEAHPSIDTEMLQDVMTVFDMEADIDLTAFRQGQSTTELFSKISTALEPVLKRNPPDWVLVHGDTTSMIAAGLSAYYQKIKVAHIEAGLRTYDITSPWPEEAHRHMVSVIAAHHFCPTKKARENLIREQIKPKRITVTGNSVIDALFMIKTKLEADQDFRAQVDSTLPDIKSDTPLILVTGHRHENMSSGLANMCEAMAQLAAHGDVQIIFPVHFNPYVRKIVDETLSHEPNISLIDPVSYPAFIRLMTQAKIIVTDSGGIQEEAPSLGIPVLVTRTRTERPEGLHAGTAILIGTNTEEIYKQTRQLLDDPEAYERMARATNPYGDGKATETILSKLFDLHLTQMDTQ